MLRDRCHFARRRLLRGSIAVAAWSGTWLLACRWGRTNSEQPRRDAGSEPKRGGTFVYAAQGLTHLDIHQTTYANVATVSLLIYNRLVRPRISDNIPEPDLAQKIEQPDELTYVFTLPRGARFHNKPPANGRELTAEDVVFSLQRARTPEPTFLHGGELPPWIG